jgi:hypothetical protein
MIEQPYPDRLVDHSLPVRSPTRACLTGTQGMRILVHPRRVRHWYGSHGKLKPVRPDTSRSPAYRLPTASPHPAAEPPEPASDCVGVPK